MLVHQIILTTKKKPTNKINKTTIMKTIKKQIILITFCVNILLCFASCAYFGAADSKMREYRQIQQDAKDALNTPDLFGNTGIEPLEKAVKQDLRDMERKFKKQTKKS